MFGRNFENVQYELLKDVMSAVWFLVKYVLLRNISQFSLK